MSDCNGWTNYETWLVHLFFTNDKHHYDNLILLVSGTYNPGHLSDLLKKTIEAESPLYDTATFYTDLLQASIDRVNWYELAKQYINQYQKEDSLC